jgi:hypothetical protein
METEIDAVITQALDQGKVLDTDLISTIAILMQRLDKRRKELRPASA